MLNRNHALSVFDPFREMEKIEKHFFDEPWGNFSRTFADSFRTDVTDEGDHFKITADLPGFEKENIHLDLYDDALTIPPSVIPTTRTRISAKSICAASAATALTAAPSMSPALILPPSKPNTTRVCWS